MHLLLAAAAAAGGDGVDRQNSCGNEKGDFEKDSASRTGLSAAAAAALPDNNNKSNGTRVWCAVISL